MITLNGIRNAIWCLVAFGIVACAATLMPLDRRAVIRAAADQQRADDTARFDDPAISAPAASGSP
jgi:hypothetical protein